jgi:pimeloyl-ACP methyl ester carboxylesterase
VVLLVYAGVLYSSRRQLNQNIRIAQTIHGPIEYRREGTGPVVLVLNGGHCSRNTRLSHERLASEGFTVITPSRPGYDTTPASVGRTAHQAAHALASLLDVLNIPKAAVVGISAAGPTAIAFAQHYPARTSSLILESAVTLEWDAKIKRTARLLFGRTEALTWFVLKRALALMPTITTRAMMREFTTLKLSDVWRRMSPNDIMFVQQMIGSMQSGTGFMLDIEHHVDAVHTIQVPVLVMYSPFDKSVPPRHAQRMAREVSYCELYEVQADSHLIWIGSEADRVWRKRLSFLQVQQ